MMSDDMALVREFAARNSETAFAALVERHIGLVHSSALRQTGDAHLAEEITQAVFIILARKAKSLGTKTILSAWLYRTTRYAAADALKLRRRRAAREQEAHMQSLVNEPGADDTWAQLAPLLDGALAELAEADRAALVLRYFENKSATEIAAALNTNSETAQKRVSRALEKLRKIFSKRGVSLTATVIAGAVSANSVQAAPIGLAATVTAAKGAGAGAAVAALTKATLKTMAWLKFKFAAVTGAAVLAAGAVAIVIAGSTSPPQNNPALARQMLQAVFAHVSAPLPPQMRFVAETELASKPWTEAQILAEVKRGEDDERKRYENIPGLREADWAKARPAVREQHQRELAELREIRLEDMRFYHSGTRTFIMQEWLALNPNGSLWRADQKETTLKPEKIQAMYKPLPAGVFYDESLFNICDTNFIPEPLNTIDHRFRSAVIGKSLWSKENFWQAATLEPVVAFLLTFSVGDIVDMVRLQATKPKAEKDVDSFAGIKLSALGLDLLVKGWALNWTVQTEQAELNGRKLAVLRLKGRTISLAHGEEIAFFADAEHLTNICRIELTKMPLIKTPYISTRDDFDTNGFPHTWIVETPNDKWTVKKTVKFKEVDFHAQFDNKEVFSPEIPAGYQVQGRAAK